MSSKQWIGLLCIGLALAVLFVPVDGMNNPLPSGDLPTQAFKNYETLWRKHAVTAADKIAAGELDTEKKIWDFLANGQEPIRKVSFSDLAKSEKDYFDKQGGWTKEAHEKLLRSYGK